MTCKFIFANLLFLLIFCQFAIAQTPDLIYHNGTILTMEASQPQAEAIAIVGESILAVGSNTDLLALAGVETQLVNLQGSTVLPGFNDSHSHWFSWREHRCELSGEVNYPELEEIMQLLSRNGWTSISELNFGRPDFAADHLNNALALDSRGELSVRLNGYWGTLDDVSLIQVLEDSMRTPDKTYSPRVRATGVKMYVDNPFGDHDILTQQQTDDLVQRAHDNGWQVAAHAVNESAVEKILNAYETVLGADSNQGRRHRIEHAVKITDDQLARINQKGIIVSFQLLGPADWPTQETFASRFTGSNPEWIMRWKDLVESETSGVKNVGSTDAPFNESTCNYSPFLIIYQAVTRKGYIDRTQSEWELTQRLTIEQCLKLLTRDGAYATFEEDKKGSLKPGKWADLVIVSANPLDVAAPEALLDIKVLLTMVGGQVEYCDETSTLCSPTKTFRVNDAIITASNYLPDQTPDKAYDGNLETNWGAGDSPPQWIEVDLMKKFEITGMDLVIDQFPSGSTTHLILAKNDAPGELFTTIHQFNQTTDFGQTLNYNAPDSLPAYRYFRVLTFASPSWVSWKEIIIHKKDITKVEEKEEITPETFTLKQNYPNPFNPSTVIEYNLPTSTNVQLTVYATLGQQVRTLVNTDQSAGQHKTVWDGRNNEGMLMASGLYFYRISTDHFNQTRKLILLR